MSAALSKQRSSDDEIAAPAPSQPSAENQEWIRTTLARIAEGGREEEVAAWRAAAAEREAARLASLGQTSRIEHEEDGQ